MLDRETPGAAPRPAPDIVDRHIGGRAGARRQALGLTLDDVAQALGVDGAALYELEHGYRRFAARQLWTLSHRLQVPVTWFFNTVADGAQANDSHSIEMIFVPNPDLDRRGGGEPVPIFN